MCTLSWLLGEDGYEVHFNRDESRSRPAARPPVISEVSGRRVLAPTDAQAGGTWIAVNNAGLGLALLNRYDGGQARGARSRGLLVRELASLASPRAVSDALDTACLTPFGPFELALFFPGQAVRCWSWDGRRLSPRVLGDGDVPLTSSGFDADGVRECRRKVFGEAGMPAAGTDLAAVHRSHLPEKGPYSVCMHRSDAVTVSYTRLRVDARQAEMDYLPGSPCRAARSVRRRLALEPER